MNLLRAAATVSGLTLLSRITGLARENLTASLFGVSALTDAFFVAFRLPNMLRRLFAEGAFAQAFVPMLADRRAAPGRNADPSGQARTPDPGARQFIDAVASALFWTLVTVTVGGIIAAPGLVTIMASGLAADPQAMSAAIFMTRLMFPYILLISLVALAAGILNTWKHFAVPAFTPVLLNLSVIATAWLLSPRVDPPVYALAAGVMIGGGLQLFIQWPALARISALPRITLNPLRAFAHADARAVVIRMAPAVLAVSVAQLSLLINTHIASRLAPGSVSWISFADRLMEFPTALLGVALGTVLLPSLSRAGREDNPSRYGDLIDWGLRLTVLLALPCMAGLALMAEPLTAMLFHYGRFGALDVEMTRQAVLAYSVGLLGLIAVKVLAPAYYARQDIRTPVRIAIVVLVATQLLNLVMVPLLQHAGLALSISLGAWANAALLLAGLVRRGTWRPAPGWAAFLLKTALATGVVAMGLAWSVPQLDWVALRATPMLRVGAGLGLVTAAALGYLLILTGLGLRPRQFVRRD